MMGMDGGFSEHSEKQELKAKAQDEADFVAAMNGTPNGRQMRFGAEQARISKAHNKDLKKQSEAELVRLSAAYQALFKQTMQDLHDTRDSVYEARILAGMALEQSEKRLKAAEAQASTTADGEAVFVAVDGAVYQKDGRVVEASSLDKIHWRDDAPSWEEYQDRKADVQAKQAQFDRMNAHEMRLAQIEARMNDEDNKPSMEALEAFKEEIDAMRSDAKAVLGHTVETSMKQPNAATTPELGFSVFTR